MGVERGVFFGVMLVLLVGLISASHVVEYSSGSTIEFVTSGSATFLNFSVENTDGDVSGANLTLVEVFLPDACSYDSSASHGGTNQHVVFYRTNSTTFYWWNSTDYAVLPGTTEYFWGEVVCSSEGSFNIVVKTMNALGTQVYSSLDLNVSAFGGGTTDTVDPVAQFGDFPENESVSSESVIPFVFRCSDDGEISSAILYGDFSGEWKAEYEKNDVTSGSWINHSLGGFEDGTYHWAVYCEDSAGNFDWTGENRTFHVDNGLDPDDQGFWEYSITAMESDMERGYTREIMIKRRVIFLVDKEYHSVGIINVTNDSATINVSSDSQQEIFHLGDVKLFELTGDNKYDVQVTLNSVANARANITMIYASDDLPGIEENSSEEGNFSAGDQSGEASDSGSGNESNDLNPTNTLVILVISVGLILVVGFVVYFFFFREKYDPAKKAKMRSHIEDENEDGGYEDEDEDDEEYEED